ncbi:DUF4179 domain-containing protein [Clostridium sporogenes]|uniref:DUF4179 domain-containing protein n=1 Tax=Clostridium sporogenes TaxID=1509 RepID=UPI00024BB0DA|nr:DUF4179 domain-containing protein [Clostridium sporogenes]EHN15974.1 hypothetical protein IYC_05964 [Clostridium sporogenes PA 3679]MCW6107044.1 DUF4179 domain-containing protein [Clostridium sporogenes]MDU4597524.1 DUF4179 domain-containing protein [Clostridium sporogenes]NFQ34464.1 DUF4179 domain-containing protein [Clostridium sporogenes]NFQ60033.1 DUF4179 domain-containing protein [Clostridium sporogenes]
MNKDIFEEKDILELFNYINIDKDEEENLDLNMDDLRKKRLKKNLLKQVKGKRTKKNFKYKAVAASLIIAVALISVNIPAFAKNISEFKSVIQSLIGYGVPKEGSYGKYSNGVNKSVTDKGITLTINEVVCDDTELMIAYTIKTQDNIKKIVKEVKEATGIYFSFGQYIKIDGKEISGGSSSDGKYLDGHTYINSESIDIGDMNLKNSFNVDLNVKNIYDVIGNWNLKFSVSKNEAAKHTKVFKPNTKVQFDESLVNVEKVSFTPMNTNITVTGDYKDKSREATKNREEDFKNGKSSGHNLYDWFVFDDKGNEIIPKGSKSYEKESLNDYTCNLNLVAVKSIPKNLNVVPYRINFDMEEYKKYKSADGSIFIPPIYKDINGVYPIELSQGSIGKLIIKEIKTKKDRTVVKYKVEGKAPFLQAKELFIMDDKDNAVQTKDNNFQIKKDKNSPNGYIMEFQPLDKNIEYKIGTNDLGYYEIRNDLKFRIDLTK